METLKNWESENNNAHYDPLPVACPLQFLNDTRTRRYARLFLCLLLFCIRSVLGHVKLLKILLFPLFGRQSVRQLPNVIFETSNK